MLSSAKYYINVLPYLDPQISRSVTCIHLSHDWPADFTIWIVKKVDLRIWIVKKVDLKIASGILIGQL